MASVYKCHEPALDRHVAVKVLPREFLHDQTFAERFRREAKVIARLEHPNIVPIHAFGIEDGIPWMAMRCIAGGSLSGLLKNRRIDERRVMGVLRGVADALDHAHGQGIVHRDVKPQNILLDDAGRVYLADFGIAKMAESSGGLTATGMITGTPQYMAPEQAKGVNIDHRADIYALGVVAYELLTGQPPFAADTPVAILMKHLSEPVPRPSALDLHGAASDALIKCLAKEPADRWPTAAAFVDALDQALGQAMPTLVPLHPTKPNNAPEATRQAARAAAVDPGATPFRAGARAGWLVATFGGVAVLLGLGGIWLLYEAHRWFTAPRSVAEAPRGAPSAPPVPAASESRSLPLPSTAVVPEAPTPGPSPTPSERNRQMAPPPTSVASREQPPTASPSPVPEPQPALPSAVPPVPQSPPGPAAVAAPGGSEGVGGTLAFNPGVSGPLSLQSGAVTVSSVRFQVREGRSGRFKRMVLKGGGIATVQAAIELLRRPKAGDWDVVIGVELLDAAAHQVAAFEENFGVEDDRSTVNLVHELGKDDLGRVTQARIHLQATPD